MSCVKTGASSMCVVLVNESCIFFFYNKSENFNIILCTMKVLFFIYVNISGCYTHLSPWSQMRPLFICMGAVVFCTNICLYVKKTHLLCLCHTADIAGWCERGHMWWIWGLVGGAYHPPCSVRLPWSDAGHESQFSPHFLFLFLRAFS